MKGWDPQRKCYVNVKPDTRGRMNADRTITPCGDTSWAGEPMTDEQAAAYEVKRARIIAGAK